MDDTLSGKELKAKDIVLYLPGKKIKELPPGRLFDIQYGFIKTSDSDVLTKAVLYINDTKWAFIESN